MYLSVHIANSDSANLSKLKRETLADNIVTTIFPRKIVAGIIRFTVEVIWFEGLNSLNHIVFNFIVSVYTLKLFLRRWFSLRVV